MKKYIVLLLCLCIMSALVVACKKEPPLKSEESTPAPSQSDATAEGSEEEVAEKELPEIPAAQEIPKAFMTEGDQVLSEFEGMVYFLAAEKNFDGVTAQCLEGIETLSGQGESAVPVDLPEGTSQGWLYIGEYGDGKVLTVAIYTTVEGHEVEVNY